MADESEEQAQPGLDLKAVCPTCRREFPQETTHCPDDNTLLLLVPEVEILIGHLLDGRYELGNPIGFGGMGVVYRAYQRSMEREVAVKVLHPSFAKNPKAVQRFFREAQASSRLIHPNVVTVYDFGCTDDERFYMVMEYLEGWTLGDLIDSRAPLEAGRAVAIALQVCAALEAAHESRIVHCDLKPDNIHLVPLMRGAGVKVLDFGIARIVRDPGSALVGHGVMEQELAGTPGYVSPEQLVGRDATPRSDLYALGVLIFEMLTGELPFDGADSNAVFLQQLNATPRQLSDLLPTHALLPDLEALVGALIERDPDNRPPNARVVREHLEACPAAADAQALMPMEELGNTLGLANSPTRNDITPKMSAPTLVGLDAPARLGNSPLKAGPSVTEWAVRANQMVPPAALGFAPRIRDGRPDTVEPSLTAVVDPNAAPAHLPMGALAWLQAPNARALNAGAVGAWLTQKQEDGWTVHRKGAVGLVVVCPKRATRAEPSMARVAEAMLRLQSVAQGSQISMRIGLSAVRGDATAARDLARALSAAVAPGDVAIAHREARALALPCAALRPVVPPGRARIEAARLGDAGRTPFVGRAQILKRLQGHLTGTRTRGAQRISLRGRPGRGRTALLNRFGAQVPHIYIRVSPASEAWPGHTIARLVRAALGLTDDAPPDEVQAGLAACVPREAPILGVLLEDKDPTVIMSTTALATSVVEALAHAAGDRPFAILLDDVHRVDGASRILLERVALLAASQPWLFVGTAVSGAPRPILFDGGYEESLSPFAREEVERLLDILGVATPDRRDAIIQNSGGHPLAIRMLAARPGLAQINLDEATIFGLLEAHLARLGQAQVEDAWLSAVFGVDGQDPDASGGARWSLERGLSVETTTWLVRLLTWRQGAHAGLDAHFRLPTLEELRWRATRHERLGLWRLAAESWERAASVTEGLGRADGLRRAAELRGRAGDVYGAVRTYEAARSAETPPIPLTELRLGAALLESGDLERAGEVLEGLSLRAGALDADIRGELSTLLARLAIRNGSPESAMVHVGRAREAVALLKPVDARAARTLEGFTQEARAAVAITRADLDGALTNLRQASKAFRDLGRSRDALRCLVTAGWLDLDAGRPKRAHETFLTVVGLAGSDGLITEQRRAYIGVASASVSNGRADAAIKLLTKTARGAREEEGHGHAVSEAAIGLAEANAAAGLVGDACRYGDKAVGLAATSALSARAHHASAAARQAAGQFDEARALLGQARELARKAGEGILARRIDASWDQLEEAAFESSISASMDVGDA